jgi:hypothetical protein
MPEIQRLRTTDKPFTTYCFVGNFVAAKTQSFVLGIFTVFNDAVIFTVINKIHFASFLAGEMTSSYKPDMVLMAADFKLGLTQSRPGGVMAPSRTIRTAFVATPCWDNIAQVPQVSKKRAA